MTDYLAEGTIYYNSAVKAFGKSSSIISTFTKFFMGESKSDEAYELFDKAKNKFELAKSHDDVINCLEYMIKIQLNDDHCNDHEMYKLYMELADKYDKLKENIKFEITIHEAMKYISVPFQIEKCKKKLIEYYKSNMDMDNWIMEVKSLLEYDNIHNKNNYYEELICYYIQQSMFNDAYQLSEKYINSQNNKMFDEYHKFNTYYNLLSIIIDCDGYLVNKLNIKHKRYDFMDSLIEAIKKNNDEKIKSAIKENTKYASLDEMETKLCVH